MGILGNVMVITLKGVYMDQVLEKMRNIIRGGGNIVVLAGMNITYDVGLNGVSAEHIAYDVEEKYGYSNDEMASSLFYTRRAELFYKYYKEVILNIENPQPSSIHYGISRLQQCGKLSAVVTRSVYSLYNKAGCNNVIQLHGSVDENVCPRCKRLYDSNYIKHAKGIPVCEQCGVILRPGFALKGEMIDNGKISRASNAVENASILLVIGAGINSTLCRYMVKYYKGDKLLLLNDKERVGDDRANYRAYGNIREMFAQVMDF